MGGCFVVVNVIIFIYEIELNYENVYRDNL